MNMLQLRKYQKSKRPSFFRQDSKKRKKVSPSWRRPKGIQSKQRLKRKGHPHPIEIGYRSPKQVRGANKTGLFPAMAANPDDVSKADPKIQGIIIRKGVGLAKKMAIIEAAARKGIPVLNVKMEKLQQKKERMLQEKQQEKKPTLKKAEKKEKPVMTEEEKKEAEKEEKDRTLIKREM